MMKVRKIEKDIYNYIKKEKVVTHPRIGYYFGRGDFAIESRFIDDAIVAAGLSSDVCDAIINLRENGSIFEIACGLEFHNLMDGTEPGIYYNLPVTNFKHYKSRYGYAGKSWLPVIYCSEAGLKELVTIFFREIGELEDKKFTPILTELDKTLKRDPIWKLNIMCFTSDLFDGEDLRRSGLWAGRTKEVLKMTKEKENELSA